MRRKSERSSASKKSKVSPEKKVDKTKRTRTKRRKQSVSSDNESADDTSSVQEIESVDSNSEPKELQAAVKENELEESHEQVWQVKTAEVSGDVGEIKKLKICLTRPPSTPEMVESSPHSKRKQSRTTSSSDTPSTEGGEERKKKKHSKRSSRESKDGTDKGLDSHDDSEIDNKKVESCPVESTEVLEIPKSGDTSMPEELSLDNKIAITCDQEGSENQVSGNEVEVNKDVDTPVVSLQSVDTCNDSDLDKNSNHNEKGMEVVLENIDTSSKHESEEQQKQENLECDNANEVIIAAAVEEVSNNDKTENRANDEANSENKASENHVVDTSESEKRGSREASTDLENEKVVNNDVEKENQELKRSDSIQSNQEECVQHETVLVVNRKRRWGSRPNKIATQKSITISTDILKEIIPDVKPVEFEEIIEEKKQHKRVEIPETIDRPVLPKIVIDNTEHIDHKRDHNEITEKETKGKETHLGINRKISIVKDNGSIITRPPSPPRNKQSCILFITNLVRPFTLPQLKNLLQRTGRIIEDGFWIDKIKSKCFVKYETEDQAVETRHALHGVTWPVSNPKTLHVDFSTQEAFDNAKVNEEQDNAKVSTVPGTVEDWLREQDAKRERGDLEKPWERKTIVREWDVGKNGKEKEKEKFIREDHLMEKRRHRTPERSPEPVRKFKRKEEEAPAKLLDDLFRKTKSVPCIYWLPLSAETIAIKEEQRRKHMAEHERRMSELRRTQRRH